MTDTQTVRAGDIGEEGETKRIILIPMPETAPVEEPSPEVVPAAEPVPA
jgi:hypothetical protein